MDIQTNNTMVVPEVWREWVYTNLQKRVPVNQIINILKTKGFSQKIIESLLDGITYTESEVTYTNNSDSPFSDEWKEWIAINLTKGICQDTLKDVLLKNGFVSFDIERELQVAVAALSNPYIKLFKQTDKLLAKREWLMATCDELAQLDPSYNKSIDVIDTPDFDYFLKHYYSKHLPVVLKGGIDHWPAMKKWTPKYFAETFGDMQVEVQSNRQSDELFERNSIKHRKLMKMSDYVDLIEHGGESNDYYMTANNTQQNIEAIKSAFEDLGDFGKGYRKLTDDPTFNTYFWLGPKGVFTPLHHDLTNNMLVQIYGRKKVTLIPALQVPNLYNDSHVFSQVPFPQVDYDKYPLMRNVTPMEVVLEAGDALFIPIAWWHCVNGIEKSISISFTNFNAPNSFSASFKEVGI